MTRTHSTTSPVRLVAVGCSSSKVDETSPAKALYKGSYWTCKRRYGETVGDEWQIVSAEHAMVPPDRTLDPYETTVGDLEDKPASVDHALPNGDAVETLLDEWALRVHNGLREWLSNVDADNVQLDVLLGRRYRDPLEERGVFELDDAVDGSLTISHPFQEVPDLGGIGKQMAWLNEQSEKVEA